MTGTVLADLRAELARIVEQIEAAIAVDAQADTTKLEDRANEVQDQIDAILEIGGAEVYKAARERPTPDPPTPGRLF